VTVVVHAFVAGLQEYVPHAVSFAAVHCTQEPALQTPFPGICVQSVSAWHAVQAFVEVSQRAAVALVQPVFARHATQVVVSVLQTDVAPEQSPLVRHPTHVFEPVSQTDVATFVQFEFFRHATHLFVPSLQTGVSPEHFPLQGAVGVVRAVVPPFPEPPFPLAPPSEIEEAPPELAPAFDAPALESSQPGSSPRSSQDNLVFMQPEKDAAASNPRIANPNNE
jgi:hypothetical protein